MKMKIRPEDTSTLQMSDWLAELREDGRPQPPADTPAGSISGASYQPGRPSTDPETPPSPPASPLSPLVPAYRTAPAEAAVPPYRIPAYLAAPVEAASPAYPASRVERHSPAEPHPTAPAEPQTRPEPRIWAGPDTRPEPRTWADPNTSTRPEPHAHPEPNTRPEVQPRHAVPMVRSVIGDQLRMPVMWCEMGSCISRHADPAALGEADMRARAISAGWRIDAFGRLTCPQCQQTDPAFRISRPVVLWDRATAMARAARIVAER